MCFGIWYDIDKDTEVKRTKERRYLMSLKIDEYLSASQAVAELLKNQTTSQNVSTQDAVSEDTDSYVSTIGSSDTAMPSENYNDILKVIQKTKADSGQSQGSSASGGAGQTGQASGTGVAGGTGGGGASDDETTTTTKTVVINGITYLETTTVENGVTSVQRTAISGAGEE